MKKYIFFALMLPGFLSMGESAFSVDIKLTSEQAYQLCKQLGSGYKFGGSGESDRTLSLSASPQGAPITDKVGESQWATVTATNKLGCFQKA